MLKVETFPLEQNRIIVEYYLQRFERYLTIDTIILNALGQTLARKNRELGVQCKRTSRRELAPCTEPNQQHSSATLFSKLEELFTHT